MDKCTTKRCTICGLEKPATKEFFSSEKRYTSGFHPHCKKCRSRKSNEYNKRHSEKRSAYDKQYRETHRGDKRRNDKKSREKTKSKIRLSKYAKFWRLKHPDRWKVYMSNAYGKRKAAEGKYDAADILIQLKMQKGVCWWCGCELNNKYHVDHRIPLARGGSNWPNNICLTCSHCNLSKGAKMPWEWSDRLI